MTAAATRDAKAVAQGVFDGLKAKGPLNINKATKQELQTLPGIDPSAAERIIASRPYETSMELVRRHVISKAAYGVWQDREPRRSSLKLQCIWHEGCFASASSPLLCRSILWLFGKDNRRTLVSN